MRLKVVSFETAKKLDAVGFDCKCRGHIHCSHFHLVKNNKIPDNVQTHYNEMFAPLKDWNNAPSAEFRRINPKIKNSVYLDLSLPELSLVQMWLREKHNIIISITPCKTNITDVNAIIYQYKIHYKDIIGDRKDYNEALEVAILKAIKLIK